MTAHTALQLATDAGKGFLCGLRYYAGGFGNLVFTINETYDTFASTSAPFYYWEFFYNNQPAGHGIDQTTLNAGDSVSFAFQQYSSETHAATSVGAKHAARTALAAAT